MFGLSGFKLGGLLVALVIIIAALTWLIATVRSRDHLQALEDGHKACLVDLRGRAKANPDFAACDPEIAAAAIAQRDGRACDAALGDATGRSDDTIRVTCSGPVRRLQATTVTLTANLADLTAQLAVARADAASAVTRGEARAATANTRTHDAQAAISRAPIGADGLVRCAGDCLRALAGDAVRPAHP